MKNIKTPSEAVPLDAMPPVSLERFMTEFGVSPATCWRYRKRGWLETIVICGRHYITRPAIAEFNRRAALGEFAGSIQCPAAAGRIK
jgi:hypothetical protein